MVQYLSSNTRLFSFYSISFDSEKNIFFLKLEARLEAVIFSYPLKSERNSRNSSFVYFSVPHIDENQIVRLVEELLWLSFELMLHFEIPYYFNEPS